MWRRLMVCGFASTLALGAVSLAGSAPTGPATAAFAAGPTALINGATVASSSDQSPKSDEQVLAEADGFTVTVVDGATWDSMTKAQFRAYDVLIIGDPACTYTIDPSVTANLSTWTQAVMESGGNRFTIGSDPVYHSGASSTNNRNHIIKDGIAFAGAASGATGAYVSTSCDYTSTNTNILDALSVGGTGWSVEQPACSGNIGIVAAVSGFTTTDTDLSGWNCSTHADYPSWANDWVPFAISLDAPTQDYCANDVETNAQVCGEPYILLAGNGVTVTSDISLSPATASHPFGTDHTVTATVTTSGDPVSGKTVTFTVSAGPNAGATGSGVTDSNGQTSFTYHDDGGPGTDTIVGSFTDDGGHVQQATASVTWTPCAGSALDSQLTVGSSVEIPTLTPNNASFWTATVHNAGAEEETCVSVHFTVDAGSLNSLYGKVSQGAGCTFQSVEGSNAAAVDCDLGTLGAGADATASVDVQATGVTPPATITATVDTTSNHVGGDEAQSQIQVVAPVPGQVDSDVPPGGQAITDNGTSPSANIIAKMRLPKFVREGFAGGSAGQATVGPNVLVTSDGSRITMQRHSEASRPDLCPDLSCQGDLIELQQFVNYTDPAHPAVLVLTWNKTVIGTGLSSTLYVEFDSDPGVLHAVPKCTAAVGGNPPVLPCVSRKRINARGALIFTVHVLSSNDPVWIRK
ncbi:MAG: hypothetical protein QOH10_1163 [Actinomycetota bacterium]|nr:hypothetical protein [Actinomycetota bacterium]